MLCHPRQLRFLFRKPLIPFPVPLWIRARVETQSVDGSLGAHRCCTTGVGYTTAAVSPASPRIHSFTTRLPSFGSGTGVPACVASGTIDVAQAAPRRVGKASPSVSIFARAPVCPDTCRYCRRKPCDVAIAHDDHTCYDCEQRLLFPERIPAWELPQLPVCDSWCQKCSTQRCGLRDAHESHLCMRCERKAELSPAPAGGGDPWAEKDEEST